MPVKTCVGLARPTLGDALASKIPVGVRHGSTTSAAAPSSVRVASRREAEMLSTSALSTSQ